MTKRVDEQAMEELEARIAERKMKIDLFEDLTRDMATRRRSEDGQLAQFTSLPRYAEEAREHGLDPTFRGFTFNYIQSNMESSDQLKEGFLIQYNGTGRDKTVLRTRRDNNRNRVETYADTGWDNKLLDTVKGMDNPRDIYNKELQELKTELDAIKKAEELKKEAKRLGVETSGSVIVE